MGDTTIRTVAPEISRRNYRRLPYGLSKYPAFYVKKRERLSPSTSHFRRRQRNWCQVCAKKLLRHRGCVEFCLSEHAWHTKRKHKEQDARITLQGLLKQTKRTATSKNIVMKTVLIMLAKMLLLGSGLVQAQGHQRIRGRVSAKKGNRIVPHDASRFRFRAAHGDRVTFPTSLVLLPDFSSRDIRK